MTIRLNTLKPRPGATHRPKRKGCGESSGHGKTCGRGGKGQTARAGSGIRIGFEGGQMPLLRRIPKRGFNNVEFGTHLVPVNVEALNVFKDGATVTAEALVEKGILKKTFDGVKILGNGELKKKLTIKAQGFSASAREKISKSGGVCEETPLLTVNYKAPEEKK